MSLLKRPRQAGISASCAHAHPCADCQVETWPFEDFMVTDAVWAAAPDAPGFLCVGCLEERLGRQLAPADFPALPANDDREVDSVRLRQCKGSGRNVEAAYRLGVDAVLDLGVDVAVAAERLGIDAALLAIWVDNARRNAEFLAETEAEEGSDG